MQTYPFILGSAELSGPHGVPPVFDDRHIFTLAVLHSGVAVRYRSLERGETQTRRLRDKTVDLVYVNTTIIHQHKPQPG